MATAKKAAAKKTTDSSTETEAPGAADMLNPMKNLKAMTDRLQELNLTGGFQVKGLVLAEMSHFVYLGLLVTLGALIALPALLRRKSHNGS